MTKQLILDLNIYDLTLIDKLIYSVIESEQTVHMFYIKLCNDVLTESTLTRLIWVSRWTVIGDTLWTQTEDERHSTVHSMMSAIHANYLISRNQFKFW